MSTYKLLSVNSDAKTVKGLDYGILTGVLYLAPGNHSGYEVCNSRTKGCFSSCLFSAGRGAYQKVKAARIKKTKFFFENPTEFFETLQNDIDKLIKQAKKEGLRPAIRLNGTSDILWENIKNNQKSLMEIYDDVQFYDYTKHDAVNRIKENKNFPKNYDLTFSLAETNASHIKAKLALKNKIRVACVLRNYEFYQKKKFFSWDGIKRQVTDGEKYDARFLDPKGSFVILKPKGKARYDTSGFVLK